MGSELQRVTGLLGAQKQGREHYSFTEIELLVINILFFLGSAQVIALLCMMCRM